MKKIYKAFYVILALLIASTLALSVAADSPDENIEEFVFDGGNTVISFDTSDLSEDQINRFINAVYDMQTEEPTAAPASLLCTLFGHNLQSETVSVIQHCVYSTAPRCLKIIYNVSICQRCDYESAEELSRSYIFCCP